MCCRSTEPERIIADVPHRQAQKSRVEVLCSPCSIATLATLRARCIVRRASLLRNDMCALVYHLMSHAKVPYRVDFSLIVRGSGNEAIPTVNAGGKGIGQREIK